MRDACISLSQTIDHVKTLLPSAIVNAVNILPCLNENRKRVIDQLNIHIKGFVDKDTSGTLVTMWTHLFIDNSQGESGLVLVKLTISAYRALLFATIILDNHIITNVH